MHNDVYPFLPFDLIIISYMLDSGVGSGYSSTARAKDEPLDDLTAGSCIYCIFSYTYIK
jgi:hypothetical protein